MQWVFGANVLVVNGFVNWVEDGHSVLPLLTSELSISDFELSAGYEVGGVSAAEILKREALKQLKETEKLK